MTACACVMCGPVTICAVLSYQSVTLRSAAQAAGTPVPASLQHALHNVQHGGTGSLDSRHTYTGNGYLS